MSLELWNTAATVGTFLVISATALAAIIQLRHMRGGNQIMVLTELRASQQTPEFLNAVHYLYSELPSKIQDPAFRYQLANRVARTVENNEQISYVETVGDYYENVGVFAKTGLVDRGLLLDIHAAIVLDAWNALIDVTAILRGHYGAQFMKTSSTLRFCPKIGLPHTPAAATRKTFAASMSPISGTTPTRNTRQHSIHRREKRATFARNATSSPLVVYSVEPLPCTRLPRRSAVRSACVNAGSINAMPSPRTARKCASSTG